jgi:hypothetical protein
MFTMLGLGTRKYQQDNEPVDSCVETVVPSCDCCRIVPCKFCIYWITEGSGIQYGTAVWSGLGWSGSAGGISFYAYIDDYCVVHVELEGIEAWSASIGCDEYDYPTDGVTCRNFDGEVAYTTYGSYAEAVAGTFGWERQDLLRLQRRKGDPPGTECDVDLVLVFDSQTANTPAVQDIQNDALGPLVAWLQANTNSYALGLITFLHTSAPTVDVALAPNNGGIFLAAVESIFIDENAALPYDDDRPSKDAMELASAQNWRSTSNKVCILVNQGYPLVVATRSIQYSIAANMQGQGITTNAISTGYWTDPGPTHAFHATTEEVNGKTALVGGGTHTSVISDGDLDYNGGAEVLASTIKGLVDTICPPDPDDRYRCARPFCNTCNCTCDELCISITAPSAGATCTGTASFSGTLCNNQTGDPRWIGTIGCSPAGEVEVEIILSRNEYTDACELTGTVVGTIDGVPVDFVLSAVAAGDCRMINATWTEDAGGDTYTINATCLECGTCTGCCDLHPDVLTCTFESPGCPCLDGVQVLMDKVSTGNGWEYGADPGACFPPNPMAMDFSLTCTNLNGCANWYFEVVGVQGCVSHYDESLPQQCDCLPLILEFDVPFVGIGGCCDGGIINTKVKFIITF